MSRHDDPLPPDEEQADEFAEELVDLHEILASGRTPRDEARPSPDPAADLDARLSRAVDFLRMLEDAWPRSDAAPTESTLHDEARDATGPTGDPEQFGRFRIVRQLGQGGCGVVFLAIDPRLGRRVALKVPQLEGLVTPSLRRRFHREAEAAAGLDHPNIIPIFEVGEVGPICYIASAYCEGPSLADWLRKRPRPDPPETVSWLVAELASAVEHAHRHGVLHRDIKPGNVLLSPNPGTRAGVPASIREYTPRLADFGMAKLLDGSGGDRTRSGAIMGTPTHMAPEQAEGRSHAVGPATDVYALGVILYEMLVDRPPFRGDSDLGTLRLIVSEEPVSPRRLRPAIPRDLEVICLKCLEKDPHARYPDAASLADDLGRFLAGETIRARPTPSWRIVAQWARRKPALAGLIGSILTAFLMIWAGLLWHQAELSNANDRLRALAGREQRAAEEADRQRLLAEHRERIANRHLYAVNLLAAQQEYRDGRFERAIDLLDTIRPEPGQADPRGFAWHYLRDLIRSEVELLDGHAGRGAAVVVSPDGSRLASANYDGTVRIWDLPGRRCESAFHPGWTALITLAFSPDGRTLIGSGVVDKDKDLPHDLILWDLPTGRERARLDHGLHRISSFAIAPSGNLMATAGMFQGDAEGEVAVWNLSSGDRLRTLRTGDGPCRVVAFSPDGRTLAADGPGGSCLLWEGPTGRPDRRLLGHRDEVHGLAFAPDGSMLATGSTDRTVRVWDMATGQTRSVLPGDRLPLRTLAFSPDGRTLLTSSIPDSGRLRPEAEPTRLFDVESGELRATIDRRGRWINFARFSPDGRHLVTAGDDSPAMLWDAETGRLIKTYADETRDIFDAAFTPDGQDLILACFEPRLQIWHLAGSDVGPTIAGHRSEVWALQFSPDGRRLVSGADDNDEDGRDTVRLWDADSGRPIARLDGHAGMVISVAFSPDGSLLATASLDGRVILRPVDRLHDVRVLRGHDGHRVRCVAFSPDGATLASSGEDGSVALWDVASGSLDASFDDPQQSSGDTHRMAVWTVAFAPDGRTLASGNAWGTIILWDLETRSSRALLQSHLKDVRSLAFSPDGRTLASGSHDQTVRLWDVLTGQELLMLDDHAAWVNAVTFSPDGRTLASGSHDGAVLIRQAEIVPRRPDITEADR